MNPTDVWVLTDRESGNVVWCAPEHPYEPGIEPLEDGFFNFSIEGYVTRIAKNQLVLSRAELRPVKPKKRP